MVYLCLILLAIFKVIGWWTAFLIAVIFRILFDD